jgi:hypothetical protein
VADERPQDLEEGMQWYSKAHDFAAGLAQKYGIDEDHAAAVVAALSPQTDWDRNQRLAEAVMDITHNRNGQTFQFNDVGISKLASKGIDVSAYKGRTFGAPGEQPVSSLPPKVLAIAHPDLKEQSSDNNLKALQLAQGADIDKTLGGAKVRDFYNNIQDRGTAPYVTVDTHMVRAALNDPSRSGDEAALIMGSNQRYEIFAKAIRQASSDVQDRLPGITPAQLQAVVWTGWRNETNARSAVQQLRQARAKK